MLLMVGSHVGHDCQVGNHVTLANNAVLGGHVQIEDYVFLGGHSAAHQFVRIGESAMIAGVTGLGADVIPFGFAIGQRGELDGLNVVGMRRRGYSRADIPGCGRLIARCSSCAAISRIVSRQWSAASRTTRWWRRS